MNPQQPQQPPQRPPQPMAPPPAPQGNTYHAPAPTATTPQQPLDYLNEISGGPAPKKKAPSLLPVIAIAGVILALIAVVFMATVPRGETYTTEALRLKAHLATVKTVADDNHKQLRSSELRRINSNLRIFLTNSTKDFEDASAGTPIAEVEEIPGSISAKEDKRKSDLTDALTEARLNIRMDDEYARQMVYEVTLLRTSMVSLYKKTKNNKKLAEFLETTDARLLPIEKQLTAFSNGNDEVIEATTQPNDSSSQSTQ